MFGLEQYDDSYRNRWLMGLGARFMQPTRSGFAGLASNAILGSMGDLANLTQEARQAAYSKTQEERLRQQADLQERQEERQQRARIEAQKALQQITGGAPFDGGGTGLGQTLGISGEDYRSKPLDAAGRYGLGQQLMIKGAMYGSSGLGNLGRSLSAPPPATRNVPRPDGTIEIREMDPASGEWKVKSVVPNYQAVRSTGGMMPELGIPIMRDGRVSMQPLAGGLAGGAPPQPQPPQQQGAPGPGLGGFARDLLMGGGRPSFLPPTPDVGARQAMRDADPVMGRQFSRETLLKEGEIIRSILSGKQATEKFMGATLPSRVTPVSTAKRAELEQRLAEIERLLGRP